MRCPQDRLHDSAGRAEQFSCGAAFSERQIRFFRFELIEINAAHPDQARQFACRENRIKIRHAAASDFRSARLEFFSGARHCRNTEYSAGIKPLFFCKIGFDQRAEH